MATLNTVYYYIGDELEPLALSWTANGGLVDFSLPHSYVAKLVSSTDPTFADVFTAPKTTGFSGTATAPNLTVSWATTGELNVPTDPGLYFLQIVATRAAAKDMPPR